MKANYDEARDALTEVIAETDDDLATKFLEGETLSDDVLKAALRKAVLSGEAVPILVGSATQQAGVKELLEAVVTYLPAPQEREAPSAITGANGAQPQPLKADSAAPLAALVFKTTADPYVGKLSFIRVYQGTLHSNSDVLNSVKGQHERLGQLFVPRGKAQDQVQFLAAGDIGAVGKLAVTATGDSLSQPDKPLTIPKPSFPPPVYTMAVYPKSKADSDKLGTAINRLIEEDPSLVFSRDAHTSETLLSGQGDVHLDIAFQRAQRKFSVSLISQAPKIPYQESITSTVQVEHRYRLQSGGHGHYAHIFLRLEPNTRGKGMEFASEVVGGSVPKEFIPAVEKGTRRAASEGVVAGFPMVDVKMVLYDGSFHPVDSAGMDFDTCGYQAFKKAVQQDNPTLLEPIASLKVTAPETSTGAIAGDLNSKRGRILGMNPNGDGTTLVEAEVPLAELQKYALDLRALTQGRGTFSLNVARYEPVPPHLQQKVVAQYKQPQHE